MFGLRGVVLPEALGNLLGAVRVNLEASGVAFQQTGGRAFMAAWLSVWGAAIVAFGLPNTQEMMRNFKPGLGAESPIARLTWRPTASWAVGLGLLFGAGFLGLTRPSEFLYFQF